MRERHTTPEIRGVDTPCPSIYGSSTLSSQRTHGTALIDAPVKRSSGHRKQQQTLRVGGLISRLFPVIVVVAATVIALLIHGYHYNIEDQAIYLPGIEKLLNPSLFTRDADFFVPQTHSTIITSAIALSARFTHLGLPWISFLWHIATLLAYFAACWMVLTRLSGTNRGRLGGMSLMTALLTLPVAGTSLYLVDQYLHPRTLATALVLAAVSLILAPKPHGSKELDFGVAPVLSAKKIVLIAVILIAAAAVHVMMAFFGVLLVIALALPARAFPGQWKLRTTPALVAFPLRELFQPATPDWIEAARTRSQHYVLQWQWYELLGVIAPAFVLWGMARFAEKRGLTVLATLCRRTAYFAAFSLAVGLALIPKSLERLTPYQPLRMFHLVYIVMVLAAGVLLGEFCMRGRILRWFVVLLPLSAAMLYAQLDLFENSAHVEWPWAQDRNQWVQAFEWVQQNTPKNAYFALDPHYPSAAGEDYHGFRGIAERSQVADWDKDGGVVSLFPAVGPRWHREVHEIMGWNSFSAADFQRLHRDLGVDWVVIARNNGTSSTVSAADCPYQNSAVSVCRLR